MNKKLYAAAGMALSALLALSACTEKADTGSDAANGDSAPIAVTSTDETCEVAAATTTSGATTFSVKNDGSKTTEFYLLGKDGLRIVGERENIAPGSSAELVVTLQPGDYFTACKPGMRKRLIFRSSETCPLPDASCLMRGTFSPKRYLKPPDPARTTANFVSPPPPGGASICKNPWAGSLKIFGAWGRKKSCLWI